MSKQKRRREENAEGENSESVKRKLSGDTTILTKPKGIVCPKCGGTNLLVWRTVHVRGAIARTRICRDCGKRFVTAEKIR